MKTIKTYPELNVASMRSRRDRELSVWYLLRAVDHDGRGRVKEADLRQFVADQGLLSSESLRKRLHRGEGVFWSRYGGFVEYRSLFKVAALLGVGLRAHPVMLDILSFRGVACVRKAFLGTFCAEKPRRISRTRLAEMIGRSKQTTRAYPRGLKAGANAILSARDPRAFDRDFQSQGYYLSQVDGQTRMLKRLPNTYHLAGAVTAAYGMVKHYKHTSSLTRGARLYFTNATAAGRALQSTSTHAVYWWLNRTDSCGTYLWERYERVGEKVLTC